MQTFSIPAQNLTYQLPEIGEVFTDGDSVMKRTGETTFTRLNEVRTAKTDLKRGNEIIRKGETFVRTAQDPITWNIEKNEQDRSYRGAYSEVNSGKNVFESTHGGVNDLKKYNIGDVGSAIQRIYNTDSRSLNATDTQDINQFTPTAVPDSGEVFTQTVNPNNPNDFIVKSSLQDAPVIDRAPSALAQQAAGQAITPPTDLTQVRAPVAPNNIQAQTGAIDPFSPEGAQRMSQITGQQLAPQASVPNQNIPDQLAAFNQAIVSGDPAQIQAAGGSAPNSSVANQIQSATDVATNAANVAGLPPFQPGATVNNGTATSNVSSQTQAIPSTETSSTGTSVLSPYQPTPAPTGNTAAPYSGTSTTNTPPPTNTPTTAPPTSTPLTPFQGQTSAISTPTTPENTSTPPPTNTPLTPFQPPQQSSSGPSPYEAQYQSLLGSSPEVDAAQQAIQDQQNSSMQGQFNVSQQPIAQSFISGQQAAMKTQSDLSQIPLQQQLANAQQKRQASLDAVRFGLDRADKETARQDALGAQAFSQWATTQGIQQGAQGQAFDQWATQKQLGAQEKSQAFSEWATTQGLQQQQDSQAFDQWATQQGLTQNQNAQAFSQWLGQQSLQLQSQGQDFSQWLGQEQLNMSASQEAQANAFKKTAEDLQRQGMALDESYRQATLAETKRMNNKSTSSSSPTNVAANKKNDIASAVLNFRQIMQQNGWAGINPEQYSGLVDVIKNQYGSAAVLELDKALEDAGLSVDYGN